MATSPMAEASLVILEEAGKELTFQELFQKVVAKLELDESTATKRIAKMYSDLTLDKRFISLPENKWDLRKRHRLEDVLIDTSDIIVLDEDEDLDEFEDFDDEDDAEDDEEEKDFEKEVDFDALEDEDEDDYDEDIMEISKIASLSEDE